MKNKDIYILGLSCFYHDSAAVLLKNGEIITAIQEERLTRVKFDNSFPINSINYCLESENINSKDIDSIAFYEDPELKLNRLIYSASKYSPLNLYKNFIKIRKWEDEKNNLESLIIKYLPKFTGDLFYFKHHYSHAASAFFPSPFEKATIITVDGVGEWSTSCIAKGYNNKIEMLMEQRFPHSVGLLYSAFTQFIGFNVLSGEYKLMGLAPYGEPIYYDLIKNNLLKINQDGSIILNTKYFNFMTGSTMISKNFITLFNRDPRIPESNITKFEMDIASSIQKVTEEILLNMIKFATNITKEKNVCLAGGVALNCVANEKIMNSNYADNIWVQPAAGDSGGALGAALSLYYYKEKNNTKRNINDKILKGSLLGNSYSNDKIKKILKAYKIKYYKIPKDEWAKKIVDYIIKGKIIGLFQGRMEFGPRALGSRSIIADPRIIDMQRKMNLKIKFRESFRPFAPAILEDKVRDWFDLKIKKSPYMLFTSQIKDNKKIKNYDKNITAKGLNKLHIKRSEVPAITHVDYSARLQTVDKVTNPRFYDLLNEFFNKTECPILINTSFNVRGEPIVCTPYDAINCFMSTDIDILVIEDFLILKKDQTIDWVNLNSDKFKLD